MSKSRRQDFAYGAILLSLSGFLVKLIGAVFRIPLTNLVGTQAMSFYSSSYSIYIFLLSLATSGLPTGIAAMISKSLALGKHKDIPRIIKIAASIFVTLGGVLSVLGFIFAPQIAEIMNSKEAYYAVAAIMPAIFNIAVVSVFKGFFQGYNNMAPTAISNLVEAAVKLCAGYGIAYYMYNYGYPLEQVVGGAIFGVTLSTYAAMIFMTLRYVFRDKSYKVNVSDFINDVGTPKKELVRTFLIISLPIMVSSISANLMGAIDAFTVMNRLKSFMPLEEAQMLWGSYGNMVLTLFNLPSFFIVSIGMSLIPTISGAYAKKNDELVQRTIHRAYTYSSIIAFGCAFGLCGIANRALLLFFPGANNAESVEAATPLLEILCFALVCVGLSNITGSILQAIGKSYLPVISVTVGACIKTLMTWILVSIPELNIYGAPIATNIAYPVMVIMNFIFIKKHIGGKPNIIAVFLKPLIAGVSCFVAVKLFMYLFELFLPPRIALFPTIICAGAIYLLVISMCKLVSFNEIKGIFLKNKQGS